MDFTTWLLLPAAGLLAGFIDSIAGGGGLITVPLLSVLIGPGAYAIGTNKIAAVAASLTALLVYLRGGHVEIRGNILFALMVGFGSMIGALLAPQIPGEAYRWILVIIAPMILWVVYRKDLWVEHELKEHPSQVLPEPSATSRPPARVEWVFLACGFGCGLYDGIAGPGGGTLMFLSLLLIARTPLLTAMATAKLANLSSATISLVTYASTGHVLWQKGTPLAIGISGGALVGAHLATRRAGPVARAALLVVATALVIRLALQ
jgi:hypothetical protein